MNVNRWLNRQEPYWQRLSLLLEQAERQGMQKLSASEVQELSGLYRKICADLSRARTHQVGSVVVEQLTSLTQRSYTQIYQGKRQQSGAEFLAFYRWGFPEIVRETLAYTAVATAIALLGAMMGWWYAWKDPVFLSVTVPASVLQSVQERDELWMGSIVGVEPMASSNIMQNNISVTIAAFAGGIVFGVPTAFLMWSNGLNIGAIATLVAKYSLSYPFWAFVWPHGALELPAIFLSGGAGLLLASAILMPGRYRRLDMLRLNGDKAIQLMFGVVPMLTIAGVIEGFFSPSPTIPSALKYLTGLIILSCLIVYLGFSKRPEILTEGSKLSQR